jgi:putative YphP/YqiW family bacilliredoxin
MLSPSYPPDMVQPFRDELTAVGIKELLTPEEVDRAVASKGTVFCVINSICGCAGGTVRPAVAASLQNKVIPDQIVSVFAGMEKEATDKLRAYHREAAAPSSPSMVLFKDGKVVAMFPRGSVEGRYPQEVAAALVEAFDAHCSKPGPSIPPEQFSKLGHAKVCGSTIPRMG